MSRGLIYCVRNPLFPHLVKIGKTTKNSIEERGLNTSNVPEDFETIFLYSVENANATERAVKNAIKEFKYISENTTRRNEFYFACAIERAESVVSPFKISDCTESRQNKLRVAKDNIQDFPTQRYKKYYDLAKRVLDNNLQDNFSAIKKIDAINRRASTRWTKLTNEYAVRTNHSAQSLIADIRRLEKILDDQSHLLKKD